MWLLSLDGLKLPGRAAARSRPTDGFSAMTRVLLMGLCPSLATLSRLMGAGTCADRPVRLAERVRDDRVRHAEAGALPAAHARGEDGREHASSSVHDGPAGVTGAD